LGLEEGAHSRAENFFLSEVKIIDVAAMERWSSMAPKGGGDVHLVTAIELYWRSRSVSSTKKPKKLSR